MNKHNSYGQPVYIQRDTTIERERITTLNVPFAAQRITLNKTIDRDDNIKIRTNLLRLLIQSKQ